MEHNSSKVNIGFTQFRRSRLFFGVGLILLSFGCSGGSVGSYQGKFTKTTSADIGHFADYTISLINEADFALSKENAVYTRQFFDPDNIDVHELIELSKEAENLLDGIIDYSIELVTIAETKKTDADRVAAYAAYLDTIEDWVERELDLGDTHYKNLVESVRSQKKFQDALLEAQPLINAVGRYGTLLINEVLAKGEELALEVDLEIDLEYREVIEYHEALQQEKYAVLDAFEQVYRTYAGQPEAFEKLRKSRTVMAKGLVPKGEPTEADLRKIAEHLGTRLKALRYIEEETEDDWIRYRKTHNELDRLYDELIANSNRARLVFLVWVRAHQKMASGKVAPAEWFDIEELPMDLFQMGTKLVF